ncbi:hypothetical protein T4B_2314 [Trichinella pseudospiralis]|uniref:Uncharacterized protein n=2 Tax=Trichinella pseudospiralis TaxID=6337 RepID=A0A0V1G0M1_TRIPS|nr:hypothetical protein T4D_3557 [Trichinella pseudospiralis]KRZ18531.1 hypothetical protein T4B_2314 [Trichinella pseudospiralis]
MRNGDRKAVLLIDNCPAHEVSTNLSSVYDATAELYLLISWIFSRATYSRGRRWIIVIVLVALVR